MSSYKNGYFPSFRRKGPPPRRRVFRPRADDFHPLSIYPQRCKAYLPMTPLRDSETKISPFKEYAAQLMSRLPFMYFSIITLSSRRNAASIAFSAPSSFSAREIPMEDPRCAGNFTTTGYLSLEPMFSAKTCPCAHNPLR